MKLIYAKNTCAFSVHLFLEELGIGYETQVVSLEDKTVLNRFNPNGYVPVVELSEGMRMTEATAILQYLAETNGQNRFYFEPHTIERAKCLQWLGYASNELHQKIAPLFHRESLGKEFIKQIAEKVDARLGYLDQHLSRSEYLVAEKYTIADMYTFAILRLCEAVDIDLAHYSSVHRFKGMMEAMPSVIRVTELEAQDAQALETGGANNHRADLPPVNLDEYTLSHP